MTDRVADRLRESLRLCLLADTGLVAAELLAKGHEVIGIDRRPWPEAPRGVEMHEVDIRKRGAEDVFRKVRPNAVIHMATVTHLVVQSEDRYRINLGGTRAVFERPTRGIRDSSTTVTPNCTSGRSKKCVVTLSICGH